MNHNMLSNVSIKKYLESGDIIINPWKDDMMGAARVGLHLGTRLLIPQIGKVVDVAKNIIPDYEEVEITKDKPFNLKRGLFVLGETYEEIGISEKIGCLLEGKSTMARLGVSIHQTANIVDTGQKPKRMTLEIKNSGPNDVLLYPKMKFCKACFFELNPPASLRYDSKGKYLAGDANKPIFRDGELL